jgi:hypothetical protein
MAEKESTVVLMELTILNVHCQRPQFEPPPGLRLGPQFEHNLQLDRQPKNQNTYHLIPQPHSDASQEAKIQDVLSLPPQDQLPRHSLDASLEAKIQDVLNQQHKGQLSQQNQLVQTEVPYQTAVLTEDVDLTAVKMEPPIPIVVPTEDEANTVVPTELTIQLVHYKRPQPVPLQGQLPQLNSDASQEAKIQDVLSLPPQDQLPRHSLDVSQEAQILDVLNLSALQLLDQLLNLHVIQDHLIPDVHNQTDHPVQIHQLPIYHPFQVESPDILVTLDLKILQQSII